MNYFETQIFNPIYANEAYYRQIQEASHNVEQNDRVLKAVHSFDDLLNQVSGMDENHQKETFLLCMSVLAKRNGWK